MLALQKLLIEQGVPAVESLAIKVKQHYKYPNLYGFKYDQLDSNFDLPEVCDARGIVLDSENNWSPVCFGYRKFFNLQEGRAAKIDWDSAQVYEKLDGSLTCLYNYKGDWQVATSGTPDGSGAVGFDGKKLFRELFWETWDKMGYEFPDPNYTYMFELMTPENIVLIRHSEYKLVLHGMRNILTLKEEEPHGNFEIVNKAPTHELNEVLKILKSMNGFECEGFVVRDQHFNRVKCKCEDYVAKARLRDSLTLKNIMLNVQTGEIDELVAYFPEIAEIARDLERKYTAMKQEVLNAYSSIKHLELQKDFALEAIKYRFSNILFGLRKGADLSEILRDYNPEKMLNLLGNCYDVKS